MVSTDATETPTPEGEDQSQSIQAPSQETSATTAEPEYFSENFDPSTLDEALQPAYKQMQGAWTRKTQELAEQRKQADNVNAFFTDLQSEDNRSNALAYLADMLGGPDQLVAALGYEFDEQTDETPDDPVQALRAELDSLKGNLTAKEQQAAQEQYVSQVDQHLVNGVEQINATLKGQGRDELTEDEQRLIVKNALVDTEPGQLPDVKAAYDSYASLIDGRLKGWAATKQGGATLPGGQAATEVPDLDNTQERREHMARLLAARDA